MVVSFQKLSGILSGPRNLPFFVALIAVVTSGTVMRRIGPAIELFSGIGERGNSTLKISVKCCCHHFRMPSCDSFCPHEF